MNAYCLWVFEFVLYLQENPWDLHNLLLPPILKNLLIVTVGHCTRYPNANPTRVCSTKIKSWLLIDWKIVTSRKLFPSSRSLALFSRRVKQELKSRGGAGNFSLVGHNCVILAVNANDEFRRHDKLVRGHAPPETFENLSTLGCNLVQFEH